MEFLKNAYNFIKDAFLVEENIKKHALSVLEDHESCMSKDDYINAINNMKHNVKIRL